MFEGDVIIPVLSDSESASYEPHSFVHGSLSLPWRIRVEMSILRTVRTGSELPRDAPGISPSRLVTYAHLTLDYSAVLRIRYDTMLVTFVVREGSEFFLLFRGFYVGVSGYKIKLQGFISPSVCILTYGTCDWRMFFNTRVYKSRARFGHSD
jgi:hypothetical protein